MWQKERNSPSFLHQKLINKNKSIKQLVGCVVDNQLYEQITPVISHVMIMEIFCL